MWKLLPIRAFVRESFILIKSNILHENERKGYINSTNLEQVEHKQSNLISILLGNVS